MLKIEDKRPPLLEEKEAPVLSHHQIVERAKVSGVERLRARGIFQSVDVRNLNNRLYPRAIWQKELAEDSPLVRRIKSRLALGELEHPDSGMTHLGRASHLIDRIPEMVDLKEGNEFEVPAGCFIVGEYMVLNTPNGRVLEELLLCNIPVGISSRGRGDLVPNEETVEVVQENYQCETFDAVYSPSVESAYTGVTSTPKKGRSADTPEALLREAREITGADPLRLVEVGSRVACLLHTSGEKKVSLNEETRGALRMEHKRIVGLWQAQATNAKAGAAPGANQKERRTAVGTPRKASAVASLLVEMARVVAERPPKVPPAPGGAKLPDKLPEGSSAGPDGAGSGAPTEEAMTDLQKRLTRTERLGEALLTRARKERMARLQLEARYKKLKQLSQALLDRGRLLMKQLGKKVEEEGEEGAKGGGVRPEKLQREVDESTAVVGVVDPAGRRLPEKVAKRQPKTIIEGLAAKGL